MPGAESESPEEFLLARSRGVKRCAGRMGRAPKEEEEEESRFTIVVEKPVAVARSFVAFEVKRVKDVLSTREHYTTNPIRTTTKEVNNKQRTHCFESVRRDATAGFLANVCCFRDVSVSSRTQSRLSTPLLLDWNWAEQVCGRFLGFRGFAELSRSSALTDRAPAELFFRFFFCSDLETLGRYLIY